MQIVRQSQSLTHHLVVVAVLLLFLQLLLLQLLHIHSAYLEHLLLDQVHHLPTSGRKQSLGQPTSLTSQVKLVLLLHLQVLLLLQIMETSIDAESTTALVVLRRQLLQEH